LPGAETARGETEAGPSQSTDTVSRYVPAPGCARLARRHRRVDGDRARRGRGPSGSGSGGPNGEPDGDGASLVRAHGLTKAFGRQVAVDGIDFAVARGEVFGFLGPNGAGKTTTMRMIACVSAVTGGHLRVLGLDPGRDGAAIRARLGVVPQLDNSTTSTTSCRCGTTCSSTAGSSGCRYRSSASGPRSCSPSPGSTTDALQPLVWITPLWHGVELCRGATTGTLGLASGVGHTAVLLGFVAAGSTWGIRAFRARLAS
jgi:hypothetical protein